MTDRTLLIVNDDRLPAGRAAFRAAIAGLAARVRAEGAPGVLSYRFGGS